MSHQTGIIHDFRECRQDTTGHLCAAFSAGREIGLIVSGDPGLIIRTFFQIIVAVHLKCAEIHLPESGIDFVGDTRKQQLHRLVAAFHAAGQEADILDIVMEIPQFRFSRFRQGQVRTAAVKAAFVGLGFSVADQINCHLSLCSNPQKILLTRSASRLKY